ncbi:hypothetical protein [Dyella sp.]|uniref:hypothetical protein n=1 Tax=Dyella sp. TaxID=1869338 RepID=UPI002B4673B4|nr:hypothetical protein [Dyella sp.]HKT27921.1 hypothetical protein [Dyella sp.]
MYTDDSKQTAHTGVVMQRLLKFCEELRQSNQQATHALQQTTQAAPDLLRQAAQQTLSSLAADASQAVCKGLHEPLNGFNREIIDNINRVNAVTHALMQSQERMTTVVAKLRWLVAGVLATMLLVVVAGGSLLWHYRDVMAQNQIEANLMRAYNQADVNLCDGRLCARVDRADKRYGDYLPVKPR